MWAQLEQESNNSIYTPTGILVFGEKENSRIQNVIASLEENDVPFDKFTAEEANKLYSEQLNLPSSYVCVLERDGGILAPEKAITAFQNVFVKNGGVLWENCPVTEIIPGDNNMVTLTTEKGPVLAKKVVLTVGPWAPVWMKNLGIGTEMKISRSEVYYWKVACPEHFTTSKFPVFIHYHAGSEFYYGTPSQEYPGMVKIALGGPEVDHPDNRDANPTREYEEKTSKFIAKHFKSISTNKGIYEACMVTKIEDENPILSCHPRHPNIVIGVGMSGHGFKLAPVIGKILCELALESKLSYDLSPFGVSR